MLTPPISRRAQHALGPGPSTPRANHLRFKVGSARATFQTTDYQHLTNHRVITPPPANLGHGLLGLGQSRPAHTTHHVPLSSSKTAFPADEPFNRPFPSSRSASLRTNHLPLNGNPGLIYTKSIADEIYVLIEEVRRGHLELATTTMYKKRSSPTLRVPNDSADSGFASFLQR